MPDTENTPGSASAPFETYQMSLRRAKEEAAEAREAADALKTLKETVPLWWQMVILARRDITHQSLRSWQEEESPLVDSAQSDFVSGKKSQVHEGVEKVSRVYSRFKDAIVALKGDIQEVKRDLKNINNDIESKLEKKNKFENYISDKHNEIENEKWSRKIGLAMSALISFGISIAFIIPIAIVISIVEAIFGSNMNSLLAVIFIIIWAISTHIRYSDSGKHKDIDELTEKAKSKEDSVSWLNNRIEKLKEKNEKLSRQESSMEGDLEIIETKKDTESIIKDCLGKNIRIRG